MDLAEQRQAVAQGAVMDNCPIKQWNYIQLLDKTPFYVQSFMTTGRCMTLCEETSECKGMSVEQYYTHDLITCRLFNVPGTDDLVDAAAARSVGYSTCYGASMVIEGWSPPRNKHTFWFLEFQ